MSSVYVEYDNRVNTFNLSYRVDVVKYQSVDLFSVFKSSNTLFVDAKGFCVV